ncbi:secG [Symbiodinium natans]|uniref:SecG protein n=1 Tax=Symbiodinium natans TaxID=878477 RepID=A0A812LFH5_9DINO|nr:secG [Symbiodinium natans]
MLRQSFQGKFVAYLTLNFTCEITQATTANFYKDPMKEAALTLLQNRADPNIADKNGTTALLQPQFRWLRQAA